MIISNHRFVVNKPIKTIKKTLCPTQKICKIKAMQLETKGKVWCYKNRRMIVLEKIIH